MGKLHLTGQQQVKQTTTILMWRKALMEQVLLALQKLPEPEIAAAFRNILLPMQQVTVIRIIALGKQIMMVNSLIPQLLILIAVIEMAA